MFGYYGNLSNQRHPRYMDLCLSGELYLKMFFPIIFGWKPSLKGIRSSVLSGCDCIGIVLMVYCYSP